MDAKIHLLLKMKLRHSFESYHRGKYGYYPSWDVHSSEYLARITQEMWHDWKSFFLSHGNAILEHITHDQMIDLYVSDVLNYRG